MLAFLFPGQGSQTRGMGDHLFDDFPELVSQADAILGYSVKELCLQDPHQQLNQTQYTQPAIYIVNALSYLKKIQQTQQKPDFAVGHSLGEYNALFAAEVFDFSTGLKLVKKRAELMSQVKDGAMAAILGLKKDQIEQILKQNNLSQVTIANHNSYTQFVISGLRDDIEQARLLFATITSANFIVLNVNGAFHSPHMVPMQQEFAEFLSHFKFAVPTLPVIAYISAVPYHPALTIKNLTQQVAQPVLWIKSMEYLLKQGDVVFEEVGAGKVLTGLLSRIQNGQ